MKLLIIEDDRLLSETIRETTEHQFNTTQAYDGEEGLFLAEQNIFDVIILDLMMPLMDGYEVLKQLRQKHVTVPVLILTAKDGIDDKLKGFKVGADDYLVKPFHREELLLRLEALVRRTTGSFSRHILSFKHLELNLANHTITDGESTLKLNGKQFEMLQYLVSNKNMIVTKDQIFDRIWGFDSDTSTTVVEVYASHLRKHLKEFRCDQFLVTFRGLGYMLSEHGDGHG